MTVFPTPSKSSRRLCGFIHRSGSPHALRRCLCLSRSIHSCRIPAALPANCDSPRPPLVPGTHAFQSRPLSCWSERDPSSLCLLPFRRRLSYLHWRKLCVDGGRAGACQRHPQLASWVSWPNSARTSIERKSPSASGWRGCLGHKKMMRQRRIQHPESKRMLPVLCLQARSRIFPSALQITAGCGIIFRNRLRNFLTNNRSL